LWTSGPHEALLRVALAPSATLRGEALKERLRQKLHEAMPDVSFSFEPADIVSQVMSFGSPTPIEVAVQGTSVAAIRAHCEKVRLELAQIPSLRDLQYAQRHDRPGPRGSVRADHGKHRPLADRGHLLQPLHRTEFLAGSRDRELFPHPGSDSREPDGLN
jgi:multidrug efflux pump subunit AcrB